MGNGKKKFVTDQNIELHTGRYRLRGVYQEEARKDRGAQPSHRETGFMPRGYLAVMIRL